MKVKEELTSSWLSFHVGTVFAAAGAAIPSFWMGIILIYIFAVNLVGDGLREALDPRLRGT